MKQLYAKLHFTLPEIPLMVLHPFQEIVDHEDPPLTCDQLMRAQISQQNCLHRYHEQFQILMSQQEMYPISLQASASRLVVCSKDSFISIMLSEPIQEVDLSRDPVLDLQLLEPIKVKLMEIPTCSKVGQFCIYFGMHSGKISVFELKKHTCIVTSEEFEFPVLQIEVLEEVDGKESRILAIDSAGNIKTLSFFYKSFVIKTFISCKDVSLVLRNKKRQKLKKIFRNLLASDENKHGEQKSQDKEQPSLEPRVSSFDNLAQNNTYLYTKFSFFSLEREQRLIAVFRHNTLSVFVVNNDFAIMQELALFSSQTPKLVGALEFGEGGFTSSNATHLLLIASVGNTLQCYRAVQMENKFDVLKVAEQEHEEHIHDGKFIGNNLLVFITTKAAYLANVDEKLEKIVAIDWGKFAYMEFFNEELNLNYDTKLIPRNVLNSVGKAQNYWFCTLEGKRMVIGRVHTWKGYLQQLLSQRKYLQALSSALKIYNGTLKLLSNICESIEERNNQMKAFFSIIAEDYLFFELAQRNPTTEVQQIQQLTKSMREKQISDDNHDGIQQNEVLLQKEQTNVQQKKSISKQHIMTVFNNIIFFLLTTECCEVLFSEVAKQVTKLGYMQYFLQSLSQYIGTKSGALRIPYMNDNMLKLIITYCKSRGRSDKLQRLIMQFDLKVMQKLTLLTTCLKEQLYQSLIFICCEQQDYITPVFKLCGTLIESKNDKDSEQGRRISDTIYWYLQECLLGHLTKYGNETAYEFMLESLVNFIFIPNSLEMLLQTSPSYLMSILNLFFDAKVLRVLIENENKFFLRRDMPFQLKVFEPNCITEFAVYEKIIGTMIYVVGTMEKHPSHRQCEFHINKLLTYLMLKNQFPFQVKYKLQAILFYVDNPQMFSGSETHKNKLERQLTEEQQLNVNSHLMRLMDSLLRSVRERKPLQPQEVLKVSQNRSIIQSSELCQEDIPRLPSNQPEIQKEIAALLEQIEKRLIASARNHHFLESRCYIQHQRGIFHQVLLLFLQMKNKISRSRVFSYMEKNIGEEPCLAQAFISSLKDFMRIDQKKTLALISSIRNPDYTQIVAELSGYPTIQMKIIEDVISQQVSQRDRERNEKMRSLLLKHLQLVIKHRLNELQDYVQKIDYPLQQAYKICEETGNRTGQAYVLIKSGRNMEGVMILTDIFLKACYEAVNILAKKQEYSEEKRAKMFRRLRTVLQTCSKEFQIDNERGEEIWERNVQTIFKGLNVSNMQSPKVPPQVKAILNEVVHSILSEMLKQVSPQFFIQTFIPKLSYVPVKQFLTAFNIVNSRLEFKLLLQSLNCSMLIKEHFQACERLFWEMKKGRICVSTCCECQRQIQMGDKMLSFACGHIYHEECYMEQNCKRKGELCGKCHTQIECFLINGDARLDRLRLITNTAQRQQMIDRFQNYDRDSIFAAMNKYAFEQSRN